LAIELELKAVVAHPAALRQALQAAGAQEAFRGMLRDRRFDRNGELGRQEQVLRLRCWTSTAGATRAQLGWKGAKSVSPEGYKHCEEIECEVGDGAAARQLLEALGYRVVHAIDRYVEIYHLNGAAARLEWYPRMDVLVEIEGSAEGIEALIAVAGLSRPACLPDALVAFAARFEARTGRPAVLAESGLDGEAPGWSAA
jgi:predicted adenylyl cyclase CyaB